MRLQGNALRPRGDGIECAHGAQSEAGVSKGRNKYGQHWRQRGYRGVSDCLRSQAGVAGQWPGKLMRIIFSNYDDIQNPHYGGGGARAIHEVAKRLAARHDVTVLTAKYPGCREETVEGVRYERIGPAGYGPKLGQILFHPTLIREIRRRTFDVWVENSTPPFSTTRLQRYTERPVVFLAMNLSGRDMTAKYHVPMHWVENWGLRAYRHAIAVTDTMRRVMLHANPTLRVEVIPNGVNPVLVEQPVTLREEYILFLGRIDRRHKGLDLLLDAYERIAAQVTVPLVIAGAGLAKDEAWLQERMAAMQLGERVRWLGKVTGRDKEETFLGAMVYAAPSRCEGVPLAIVEAMAYALPVVVFAIDDLAWMPPSRCVKVPPFDVDAYGQALLALAREPERRRALSRLAREGVGELTWDKLAVRYEQFLLSAVSNAESPSHGNPNTP